MSRRRYGAFGALAVIVLAALVWALSMLRERPWSEVAAEDLRFIQDVLREHHPGPVDPDNLWFRDWFERGHDEALRLAARATDYAGYYFAIQRYVRGFQDGHLGALAEDPLFDERLAFRWPGIVTAYDGERIVVVESEIEGVAPGAALVSCDSHPAATLGEQILQTYHGLWSVRGARFALAPYLLVDAGNPFVDSPRSCLFDDDGEARIELRWRPIEREALRAKIDGARGSSAAEFGLRRFADGSGVWISLPSFAIGSDDVRQGVDRVRQALARDGDAIRAAALIVFDVRGNHGGSSSVGNEIVEALWGRGVLEDVRPRGVAVDWRVSQDNARFLREQNLRQLTERYGDDHRVVRGYRELVDGMAAAVTRGDVYYSEGGDDRTDDVRGNEDRAAARHPVAARVFFLTDHVCISACLDFADRLLRIPGVVHVGRETRADAVYIDNRSARLPSGLGRLGFSMKVYRNRPRGHNESYDPSHPWHGDMRDEAALEAWILQLHRAMR